MKKGTILTGDRPTGRLHLGHYIGSLRDRVRFQDTHKCYFIVADYQVLTDHLDRTHEVSQNIVEILLDYLAVGINPKKCTIFIQSAVPQLAELTMYLSMLVTVARLRRNPTIKSEAQLVGVDSDKDSIVYGFLGYPVSQAADILLFRADTVPVGEDQLPHLEQTREIARKFNRLFDEVFPVPKALLSRTPRLPGLDGKNKMSKSLGNAIFLSDSQDEVVKKVRQAYTDPTRIHATDPGHIKGNVVFAYLDAFHPDEKEVESLKDKYREGGIGDVAVKNILADVLNQVLEPIRQRRQQFESDREYLSRTVSEGCEQARQKGEETMRLVKRAVSYDYPDLLA